MTSKCKWGTCGKPLSEHSVQFCEEHLAKQREYHQRPEVKAKKREYHRGHSPARLIKEVRDKGYSKELANAIVMNGELLDKQLHKRGLPR